METILNYLDTLFAAYPQTAQVKALKNELMVSMEDQYKALLAEGKTTNEAIGATIAGAGDIAAELRALGVKPIADTVTVGDDDGLPPATDEEVLAFVDDTKTSSGKIALGVLLCILSPVLLISAASMGSKLGAALGLALLFVMVAIAVGLFILAGRQVEKYDAEEYYKKSVSLRMQDILRASLEKFKQTYTLWLCLGIGLCVLCPVPLIVTAIAGTEVIDAFGKGIALLLLMAGVGVYMIIRVNCINECYEKLLRLGEYENKHKRGNFAKTFTAISGSLATGIFLILGFVGGMWGTAWLVFPIMGVISSAIQKASKARQG